MSSSPFSFKLELDENEAKRSMVDQNGRVLSESSLDLKVYTKNLGQYSDVDLDLLAPGVRFFRQSQGYAQVVVELPPGINRVIWGDIEGDHSAQHYMLAQPYRIIILDYKDCNFLGARIFYSLTPIYDLDVKLYNTNLSNVNCYGYHGNAVGWLCLYNTEDMSNMSWKYRINRMVERCSGEEAFNFENMSETDGIKLYRNYSDNDSLYLVDKWEDKSDAEGYEWTLYPNTWIPVMVASENDQERNNMTVQAMQAGEEYYDPEIEESVYCDPVSYEDMFCSDSVHLTLRMALEGQYSATYEDTLGHKPTSSNYQSGSPASRDEGRLGKIIHKVYMKAFTKIYDKEKEE